MKFIKPLNEYGGNAEMEHYQEVGLEGVSAKDILLNIYPETFEKIVKDFDNQFESAEFKNRNLDMLRSIIGFYSKYHGESKYIDSMKHKYNIE